MDEEDHSSQSAVDSDFEDVFEGRETARSPNKRRVSQSRLRAGGVNKRRKTARGSGSSLPSADRKQTHTSRAASGNGGKQHKRKKRTSDKTARGRSGGRDKIKTETV